MDPRLLSFMPSLPFAPVIPAITPTAVMLPEPIHELEHSYEPKRLHEPEFTHEPKPTGDLAPTKKRKVNSAVTGFGFGSAVPPENIPFPAHANLTAVELLTFLPLSTRSADVIYRLITNGGTRMTIGAILNSQREVVEEVSASIFGAWMSRAMKKAGWSDWTIKTHHRIHEPNKATWNEHNLNVGGFRTPGQINGTLEVSADMPFQSLALNVRQMPLGLDALDLTQMVQYCVQKPEELWMYPGDYDALLSRLGGPVKVQEIHNDRGAFSRWEGFIPPLPRFPSYNSVFKEHHLPQQKKSKIEKTRTSSLGAQRRSMTPASVLPSRNATPASTARSRGATPTPTLALAPARKRGRPRGTRNKAVNFEAQAVSGTIVLDEEAENEAVAEPYLRRPAEYVSPPKGNVEFTDSDVNLAFAKEGAAGERDAYGPYAFGVSRISAPYRLLHRIHQPHPEDGSGWAENLRWVFEQQSCFSRAHRANEWNESPEHMELIVKARKQQVWASDELVEITVTEQVREEEMQKLQARE